MLPEIQECLKEAGFRNVDVYMQGWDNEEWQQRMEKERERNDRILAEIKEELLDAVKKHMEDFS